MSGWNSKQGIGREEEWFWIEDEAPKFALDSDDSLLYPQYRIVPFGATPLPCISSKIVLVCIHKVCPNLQLTGMALSTELGNYEGRSN